MQVCKPFFKPVIGLFIWVSTSLQAQNTTFNLDNHGYMADGFDVVSYFSGNPEKGKKSIETTYQSVKYLFKNEENKNKFIENPEKYIPAYGGYCAYAMAKTGELVDINPKAFEIRNGKLYLFYKTLFEDTYQSWLSENPNALIQRANKNWERVH